MLVAKHLLRVGRDLLQQRDRLIDPPHATVGDGEAVPRGEGSWVVGAQHPLHVGRDLLDQRDLAAAPAQPAVGHGDAVTRVQGIRMIGAQHPQPIGGDLREGKVTLPIILLLQRGGPEAAALIHGVIADGQVTPEKWRLIRDLLTRHGAIDAAFARAVTHAERAKAQLAGAFAPSPERDGLIALADYVISRDR